VSMPDFRTGIHEYTQALKAMFNKHFDSILGNYRETYSLAGEALRAADAIVNELGNYQDEHVQYLISEYVRQRVILRQYVNRLGAREEEEPNAR